MDTPISSCRFTTGRLVVGPWHEVAEQHALDLAAVAASILDERTTAALPPSWFGDYSIERARAWIDEVDAASNGLLVLDRTTGSPVGFVLLAVEAGPDGVGDRAREPVDVRLGYLLAVECWGQGLATELVEGLVAWARNEPRIGTLTGGVERSNAASARVLAKLGFRVVDSAGDVDLYSLALRHHPDSSTRPPAVSAEVSGEDGGMDKRQNQAELDAGLAPTPGYRYGDIVGDQLFVAGQVPVDTNGDLIGPGDPGTQTRACLDNLRTVIEVNGFTVSDIHHLRIHVVGEHQNLLDAWAAVTGWFATPDAAEPSVPPATLLGAALLGYTDQLVEVEATVVRQP